MAIRTQFIPTYDKEKESEFVRLVEQHRPLIFHIIKSDGFFECTADLNDCYQEVLMNAWLNWYKYKPMPEYSFMAWFRNQIKWGILRYRSKLTGRRRKETLTGDMFDYNDCSYAEFEDHAEVILKAINSLPQSEKDFIESVFTDNATYSEFVNRRCNGSKLRNKVFSILHKALNIDLIELRDIPGTRSFNAIKFDNYQEYGLRARPIIQLDLEGKFIKSWPSAKSAGDVLGFNSKNIHLVCEGERFSAAGYRWQYRDEDRPDILHRKMSKGGLAERPVEQLTMDGVFIKRWNSITETEKAGFQRSNIRKAINGKYSHHGGYKWRYVTSSLELHQTV
jgi:RNA polymerase sigma factor (sigma-70 family)